tara:strand:+ start:11800 stop:13395 length:1596 start_codon:yes stop_codon:yes gene_type:complete
MYLEVFPEINSTSSEKQLSGTYSYWILLGDVENEPGTSRPANDTVIFSVFSNTNNSNATSDIEYLDFTDTVFVSSGKFDCAANGESAWKNLSSSSDERGQGMALARRGFTWSDSSRFLTESQVFALEENRVKVYRPGSSSSFGPKAFNSGYFFVSGQYDQSPAISETHTRSDGEEFEYVVYPKICANLPDRIIDEDSVVWFDFSAHFPSTVTLTWSGSGSVILREGGGINDPRQTKTYGMNYTATYEKIIVDSGATSVVKYVKTNQSGELDSGKHLLGPRVDYTVTFEGPDGNFDIVQQVGLVNEAPDIIFASQNRYNGVADIFGSGFNQVPGREFIYQRNGARLNKNFSQNTDACYLWCTECDGGQSIPTFDKTPYTFAGTAVDNKNSNAFLARFPSGFPYNFINPNQHPPFLIEEDNTTGGEIFTSGVGEPFVLGWAPILSWSDEAGSGSVTFELEDHQYPGSSDTFYHKKPELRCDDFFGPINFYLGFTAASNPGEGNGPVEKNPELLTPNFGQLNNPAKSLYISSIS